MLQPSTSQSIRNGLVNETQKNIKNNKRGIASNNKSTTEIIRLKNFRKNMAKSVSDFAKNSIEPENPEYNIFSNILNSNVATIFDIEDEDEDMDNANPLDGVDEQGANNDEDQLKVPCRQVKKESVISSNSNIVTTNVVNSLVNLKTCSTSSALPTTASSTEALLFISRIRQVQPSPAIDMNQNYTLLGVRYFQQIQGMDVCLDGYRPVELSVATFNVLCQSSLEQTRYLYRHLYGQRQQNLQWENRLPKLQAELDRLSADVFCLQEIQDCHFEQFFKQYFLQRGYEGQFKRRTGNPPDGCAIFWRSDRLELLKFRSIAYNLGVDGMNRDNVGQIYIFGIRGFGTAICISNTHIYFNMKKGDIKLSQIAYLLASMDQVQKEFLSEQNSHHYVHFAGHILCGDFNIYPGSPLHRFLLGHQINLRSHSLDLAVTMETGAKRRQQSMLGYLDQSNTLLHPLPIPFNRMGISGGNCTFVTGDRIDLPCTELCHEFKFASVYEHWNVDGEPELSSYHVDAIQPDYIFYTVSSTKKDQKLNMINGNINVGDFASENFIQLWKRLSLPTRSQFNLAGGPIPNEQHGSDHLSLWAGFRILCLPIGSEI